MPDFVLYTNYEFGTDRMQEDYLAGTILVTFHDLPNVNF